MWPLTGHRSIVDCKVLFVHLEWWLWQHRPPPRINSDYRDLWLKSRSPSRPQSYLLHGRASCPDMCEATILELAGSHHQGHLSPSCFGSSSLFLKASALILSLWTISLIVKNTETKTLKCYLNLLLTPNWNPWNMKNLLTPRRSKVTQNFLWGENRKSHSKIYKNQLVY